MLSGIAVTCMYMISSYSSHENYKMREYGKLHNHKASE
jgi:hypothetical protein